MKEFIPSITRQPELLSHAQFQTFDDVMMKFCKWLPHQTVSNNFPSLMIDMHAM